MSGVLRRGIGLAVLMAGIGTQAGAEGPWLDPSEFRAFVQGHVVQTLLADGRPFGAEEFGPEGAVIWQYPDGTCLRGRWQVVGGAICYDYDGVAHRSCLRYRAEGDDLLGYQWDVARDVVDWRRAGVRLRPTTSPPLVCDLPLG